MLAYVEHSGKNFNVDFSKPLDISIPLRSGKENVNAWNAAPVKIEPVKSGNWIGEVKQGGSVNFRNIFFNPHGNGTHTECVGHISKEDISLNQCLKKFFFLAKLISVNPEIIGEDLIITKLQMESRLRNPVFPVDALVIRTLPNDAGKINRQYSGSNPCYLHHEAAEYICSEGINHLLIDLPSVDREEDGGALLAHKAFWQFPGNPQLHRTITELIFVPAEISDGIYLLNLQIGSFENDASPSKPVLYKIISD